MGRKQSKQVTGDGYFSVPDILSRLRETRCYTEEDEAHLCKCNDEDILKWVCKHLSLKLGRSLLTTRGLERAREIFEPKKTPVLDWAMRPSSFWESYERESKNSLEESIIFEKPNTDRINLPPGIIDWWRDNISAPTGEDLEILRRAAYLVLAGFLKEGFSEGELVLLVEKLCMEKNKARLYHEQHSGTYEDAIEHDCLGVWMNRTLFRISDWHLLENCDWTLSRKGRELLARKSKKKAGTNDGSRRGRHPSSPERKALVKVLLDGGYSSPAKIFATLEAFEEHCCMENIPIEMSWPTPSGNNSASKARYNAIGNDVKFFRKDGSLLPDQVRDKSVTIQRFKEWLESQDA